MLAAMEAVKDGTVSTKQSALLHGVPLTSLKDRLSGRVQHGRKPGPRPYLNDCEECTLADHLIQAAKIGYCKTRKQVQSISEIVAKERMFGGTRVSNGWWERFLHRQSLLTIFTAWRGDCSCQKHASNTATCVNAIGQSILPIVIFEGKNLNYQCTVREVRWAHYGMSGKGCMDRSRALQALAKESFFEVCHTQSAAFALAGWPQLPL